jgi:hypothetical protein
MYIKLSSTSMSDITSMRNGMSLSSKAQIYDAYHGYMDIVDAEELFDVLIARVKELSDEHQP